MGFSLADRLGSFKLLIGHGILSVAKNLMKKLPGHLRLDKI